MDTQFNHSVKVPSQYRAAARLLKKTFEEGASLKGLIFQEKHAKTNRLYALIQKISDHKHELDRLVADTGLKEREPRLEKYMCAVLMTELLFGAGHLNGESKPVQCIRRYEPEFRALLAGGSNGGSTAVDQATNGATTAGGDAVKPVLKKDFEKPRYVRVNTNLLSRADALELFVKDGWIERPFAADTQTYDEFLEVVRTLGEADFVSDMHVKNLFVFPASSKRFWARNTLVREAKLVLQDKASCLPTVLLDPPRGATILDMCAAPGMKTSHLAAHIKNKGTIYAVEQHVRRYGTLCEIMASTRSSVSVQTINQDALALEDEGVPGVEYILVDPSCSGSGMTGRLFSTPNEKETDRLVLLCGLQMRMLQHAMRAFHGARKIVYSTCSVHVEENEQVVSRSLEACPDWELVKPEAFAERWKNFGSPKWKHVGKKCFYAKPEVDLTDGFFVAVFERREVAGDGNGTGEGRVHDPDRDFLQQIYRDFTRKNGAMEVEGDGEDEEYAQESQVANPFGAKTEVRVKQEPIAEKPAQVLEAIVPAVVVKQEPIDSKPTKEKKSKKSSPSAEIISEVRVKQEPIEDEPAATVKPTKEKKSKKSLSSAEIITEVRVKQEPIDEQPTTEAAKPIKVKKSKKIPVEETIAEVEQPTKEKKSKKSKSKTIVEPAAEADAPIKEKKKKTKPIQQTVVDVPVVEESAKKKKKRQLFDVNESTVVLAADADAPKTKKKKRKDAEEETAPASAGVVAVESEELTLKKKKKKKDKSAE